MQYGVGWRFHAGAIKALRHNAANMDVLVALGTNAAYVYSILAMLATAGTGHNTHDYFGAPLGCWEAFCGTSRGSASAASDRLCRHVLGLIARFPQAKARITAGQGSFTAVPGWQHNCLQFARVYIVMDTETAAMLITFICLGKLLEAHAKGQTSEALTALMNLTPTQAVLVRTLLKPH